MFALYSDMSLVYLYAEKAIFDLYEPASLYVLYYLCAQWQEPCVFYLHSSSGRSYADACV